MTKYLELQLVCKFISHNKEELTPNLNAQCAYSRTEGGGYHIQ
jgi:hypothetical protein